MRDGGGRKHRTRACAVTCAVTESVHKGALALTLLRQRWTIVCYHLLTSSVLRPDSPIECCLLYLSQLPEARVVNRGDARRQRKAV